jgi:hypothetical protein
MAMARTLLLLIGVLAVMVLGATAPARADTAIQPCHETAVAHHKAPMPAAPAPGKATAMACCVACVSATASVPPDAPALMDAPAGEVFILPPSLPHGLSPAPEPGPPRV